MFKLSDVHIHNNKVYKLMNNGWQFAVVHVNQSLEPENLLRLFRYEHQANRFKNKNYKVILIADLLLN